MENKKTEYKERINYIKEVMDDGKVAYTSVSVNYPSCCCSSWESVGDLERNMKAMIEMWLDFGKEQIENGFEMKELTPEEWNAKDDNIDYWEIERIKRLLARPTIKDKFRKTIVEALTKSEGFGIFGIGTQADDIIGALINQPNK